VHAADADGDGDIDVLSASLSDDGIAWYENEGGGSFGGQQVITMEAKSARSVYTADVDGDGDLDVLSASGGGKVAWYENEGGGSFGGQQVISTNADGLRSVHAADVDGDGDVDVLSASARDDKIAWYENATSFGQRIFSERLVSTNAEGARSVYAADVDGDGDLDVLSASSSDDKIAWYENTESTLPVELSTFTATASGSTVYLRWETASETNNAGFHVERRAMKATSWTSVGFIEGAGTTNGPQEYQFTDGSLPDGATLVTYRLRQIDTDGSAEYSPEIEVAIAPPSAVGLKANYPNPFTNATTIRYELPSKAPVRLNVYDVRGRRVAALVHEEQPSGAKEITWTPRGLASGVYVLRLRVGDEVRTQKLHLVR
jgi:hypothetical protein